MLWITLGLATILLLELFENSKGLNLADEGFLWFGVTQQLGGKRAVRDFYAYCPGRYLWAQPLYNLFPSIRSIRWSMTLFLALTYLAIALIYKHLVGSTFLLSLLGLLLAASTRPRHKRIDGALAALLSALSGLFLVTQDQRVLSTIGLFSALVLLVNLNHFLYWTAISTALSFFSFDFGKSFSRCLYPAAGFALGLGVVAIILRGYVGPLHRYLFAELRATLARGSSQGKYSRATPSLKEIFRPSARLRARLFSAVFYLYIPFTAVSLIISLQAKSDLGLQVLSATLLVSVVYFHHALARADLDHLVQILGPLCCTIFLVLSLPELPLAIRLVGATIGVLLLFLSQPFIPGFFNGPYRSFPELTTYFRSPIKLTDHEAELVSGIVALAEVAPAGKPLFFAPHFPGAYALLGIGCPTWASFLLHDDGRSADVQIRNDLEQASIGGALVSHLGIDDRSELEFPNLFPLTWNLLCSDFERFTLRQEQPRLDLFQPKCVRQPESTA